MTLTRGKITRKRELLGIILPTLVLVLALSMALSEITALAVSGNTYLDNTDFVIVGIPAEQTTGEPARYCFASNQKSLNLQVNPGGEAESQILFYNVDGNRITYIRLEVIDIPEGWEVEIDPPLHKQHFENNGQITAIESNLFSEPAELSPKEIKDIPQGMTCLSLSNRGYTLAGVVTITIIVTESQVTGTINNIKISAVDSWTGQSGGGIIKQTRDFDFRVMTI